MLKASLAALSFVAGAGLLAAAGVISGQERSPRQEPVSVAAVPQPAFALDLANATTATEPGCNSTAFTQVPGEATLFIGRQQVTADGGLAGFTGPNDCSGGHQKNELAGKPYNRWGLVLNSFDWSTRQFKLLKPILDTSLDPRTGKSRAVVTGGPMRGLIIRSAYDPRAVQFGGQILVAFECIAENGGSYGVQHTSSCIAVYDPERRTIDMSRATVAVTGEQQGDLYRLASVPQLLAYGGKLYLYWAASVMRDGKFLTSVGRGAELELRQGVPRVRGASGPLVRPFDSSSTEVLSTEASPSSNLIATIMSFVPLRDSFLMFAVLGGGDCQDPAGPSRGCFRLAVRKSSAPIKHRGFNQASRPSNDLPTNANEYPTPVIDPSGNWWVLGHFRRPLANGFADRAPAPGHQYWRSSKRESVLALIPMRVAGDPTPVRK
jgi:hypothetical protein